MTFITDPPANLGDPVSGTNPVSAPDWKYKLTRRGSGAGSPTPSLGDVSALSADKQDAYQMLLAIFQSYDLGSLAP